MSVEVVSSLEELPQKVNRIAEALPPEGVVFLRGDLAAGKTTLVKALAELKGVSEAVTSPTFSIQQVYGEGLYHYDLYQCPNEKFLALGLLEELEKPGWHLIEWGDEALESLLKEYGFVTAVITVTPEGKKRRYRIEHDA
ncbi:MAG: tRNA (adenosine(37)-N6)-threonylcarbamoyltransferase complex ATPase subunit type 1 TsaE [Epsilonproteobacteria bacterium]|nr:tRNA (adenosine(37)-N6)-threonylcarbamoyltransferase complex ATPase subunit type 1 TsaE [Campylobacterota bacterium]